MDTDNESKVSMEEPAVGEWCIIEVFGHRSHYGLLTEVERFGTKLARIDIFGVGDADPRATHFYGGASIFSITPATEESCRRWISRYEPKIALQSLPAPELEPDLFDDGSEVDIDPLDDRDETDGYR